MPEDIEKAEIDISRYFIFEHFGNYEIPQDCLVL